MSVMIKLEPIDDDTPENTPLCIIHVKNEHDNVFDKTDAAIQPKTEKEEKPISETEKEKSETEVTDTKNQREINESQNKEQPSFNTAINFSLNTLLKTSNESDDEITKYKTENNAYKCPECSKLLYYKSNFTRHLEMHNRPTFECSVCHQKFKKEKIYLKHIDSHENRNYKCDQCDNRYKNQAKLTQHKKVHDQKNPLRCKICSKVFINASCMERHKKVCPQLTTCEHYDPTKNILQCDLCIKKNKVKWVYCRFCKKRFDDLASLRPHMEIHRGEKPYTCDVCQRQFTTKSNMQSHAIIHKKPKKLTCPICSKRFPKESKLIYHMGTHAKLQPFQCKICHKKYSHKINATRHYQEKHPNEKFDTDVSYGTFAKAIVKEMEAHNMIPKQSDENKLSKQSNIENRTLGMFEEVFVKVEPLDYEE